MTIGTAWQYARLRGRYQPVSHDWEYDWIWPDGSRETVMSGDLEQLNRAGAGGWELVTVDRDEHLIRYTLKRPVPAGAGQGRLR